MILRITINETNPVTEEAKREKTPNTTSVVVFSNVLVSQNTRGDVGMESKEENGGSTSREEQEEALVALIEHRTHEVKNLRHRIAYYKTQVYP